MRLALRLFTPVAIAATMLTGCYQLGAGPEAGYTDADLGEFLGVEEGATETYLNFDPEGRLESTVVSAIVKVERDARGRLLRSECHNTTRPAEGRATLSSGVARIEAGQLVLDWSEGSYDVLLATPLRPGTRWRYRDGDLRMVAQIAAIEDVCTPAGHFAGAIKVVGVTAAPQGQVKFQRWFARGHGEVLNVHRYADGSEYRTHMSSHHLPRSGQAFPPAACDH